MKYILFVLFFPVFIYGQLNDNSKLPELFPATPKTAELLKFSETPVSKYTGVPDISIPIYSIEARGISIPIKLSYHSNGFKVEEESGSTGLGWSLNANWSIVQVVSGYDDFDTKFLNRTMPNFANIVDELCKIETCYANGAAVVNNCDIFLLGIIGAPPGSNTNEVGNSYLYGDKNYVDNFTLGYKDFQPDVFNFNLPGYSGKFILDWSNNQFYCITDSKIKITPVGFNGSNVPFYFRITLPDGNVFTFTLKENTKVITSTNISEYWPTLPSPHSIDIYGSTSSRVYQLTNVVTNLSDVVTFEYLTTNYIKNYPVVSKSKIRYIKVEGASFPKEISDNFTSFLTTEQQFSYINKITFNNGILIFNYSDRIDLVGSKKLDEIELKKSNNISTIKKYSFKYDYFIGHDLGTNTDSYFGNTPLIIKTQQELTHRLKLLSVTESGLNPYIFEYDNEQLPKKTSLAKDYWGNYNGQLNNYSSFVDIYKFNLAREYYHLYEDKDNINCSVYKYAKAAILNKITYPTGGYSTFDYELNSFSNVQIPTINQGLKKIIRLSTLANPYPNSNTEEVVIIEGGNTIFKASGMLSTVGCYPTYPNAYSSCYFRVVHFKKDLLSYIRSNTTFNSHLNSYGLKYVLAVDLDFLDGSPSDLNLYNNYKDYEETIYKTVNKNEDEFVTDKLYNLTEGIVVFSVSGSCGTYAPTATPPNWSQSTFNISYNDYLPLSSSESFGAGIRVKNIVTYSGINTVASKKSYIYQGGKLMNPFKFFNKMRIPYYSWVNSDVGPQGTFVQVRGDKVTLNTNNYSTPSIDALGKYVGYDIVDEYNINYNDPNTISTNGKISDYYSNNTPVGGGGQGFYSELYLPREFDYIDNGLVLKNMIYNNNILIKESINNYNLNEVKCFYGMKTIFRESRYYETSGNMFGIYKNYTVGVYPISWAYSQLKNSTEISYFKLNNIVSTVSDFKSYLYDSHNQVSKINGMDSKGNNEEKEFKYSYDFYQPGDNMYVGMSNRNIISPIIEATTKLGAIPTSLEKKTFKEITVSSGLNVYVPDVIKLAKSGNVSDLEDKVIFHNYDDFSNLLEYSTKDGVHIVYLWGYNQTQPIAKIENATYSSITASLITAAQTASNTGTEASLLTALNNLRNDTSLANAMITTYTHKPLIGVSTITDPKGDMIRYFYDAMNRLEYVLDKNGNKLSENQYNYKP